MIDPVKMMFLHQETKQAQQVHWDPEGEVHPAWSAGRWSAWEDKTLKEQEQETTEAAGKGQRKGVLAFKLCPLLHTVQWLN